MSGITGLGTTYNLPNYTGLLFGLTPADTPLFSAIGGMTAGRQTDSTEFEWQHYDLRSAGQNVKLEGADAPSSQSRVRGNVTNVVQVHQEKVEISYSKLAATGQKAGSNNAQANPVTSEADWQIEQTLKQMVLDVEFSFINGVYAKPADNATARKSRGLVAACTSNKVNKGDAEVTGAAATDTVTAVAHGLNNGDKLVISDPGVSPLEVNRVYFVVNKATDTFKLATSAGGTGLTIGTATVKYIKPSTTALTTTDLEDFLQGVYDNGGINEAGTATLMVGSAQKRQVTAAYATAYGKFVETSREVGGVAMNTIVTDFGTLNVVLSRFAPRDSILVVSLEQLFPVFLEVPGKGHFFAEPLAKTGASDAVQLYGEVGLAYGNEKSHGVLRGLKV